VTCVGRFGRMDGLLCERKRDKKTEKEKKEKRERKREQLN